MDCYGESARFVASMCERSSEKPSNLLFVLLLHQGLVCLSTPSETTGAQVQVSVSFAQRPVSVPLLRLDPVNV